MTRSDPSFPTSEKKIRVRIVEGFYEFYFRNPRNEYISYLVILFISMIYASVNGLFFRRPENQVVLETSGLIAFLLFIFPLFYSISLVKRKVYVDVAPKEPLAVWRGIELIVAQAIVVVALESSLVLIGLLTHKLESLSLNQHSTDPTQDSYSWILQITFWLGTALATIFGVYALIIVSLRLAKSIFEEIRGESRASTTTTQGDKLSRSTLSR